MPHLLWDASALAKRYYKEHGTDTVDAIFAHNFTSRMTIVYIGYAETAAILRRKHNQGLLVLSDFQKSRLLLEAEVLLNPNFEIMTITDQDILDGIILTDRHNINSTDAALLATYLRVSNSDCILIASDKRLIRAAEAEGISSLNPETTPASDIAAHLV